MNKLEISGRLTKDVEIRKSQKNVSCGSFALAVNEYAGLVDGKPQYDTSFFNCSIFGNKCDSFAKHYSKGDYVVLVGRIKQRKYENKQGVSVSVIEIIVEDFDYTPKATASESQANSNSTTTQPQGEEVKIDDLGNDDLPF